MNYEKLLVGSRVGYILFKRNLVNKLCLEYIKYN